MSLKRFLKDLRKDLDSGSRHNRYGDPANGLEYNKICDTHLVCKKIWKVDLARTPRVIRDFGENVDMNGEAWLANNMNPLISFRAKKCYGRGR